MPIHSEDDILSLLSRYFPADHTSLLLGRGDDCAIIKPGGPWAITCDIFAENAHFRQSYFSAADVGHKALAVNLSDVAAAGACPTGCVVALTLPRHGIKPKQPPQQGMGQSPAPCAGQSNEDDEMWLHGFAQGMADLARRHRVALAGGDLAQAACLHVCVTAWGELTTPDLRRGKAMPGDTLFLVGDVGLARTGLLLLEANHNAGGPPNAIKAAWPKACAKHLRPEPLVDEGQALARFAAAKACAQQISLMDVSDGLARDLPRLLATSKTGLGANIVLQPQSLPEELVRYTRQHSLCPAHFAFEGGEDYALLGSCPTALWPALQSAWQKESAKNTHLAPLRFLGTVTQGEAPASMPGLFTLNGEVCRSKGFDHFSQVQTNSEQNSPI